MLLLVVAAVAAPWLAPHAPTRIFPGAEISPPGPRFPLGTDEVGRDILSRVLHGARVSLGVAIASVGLAAVVGAGVGIGALAVGGVKYGVEAGLLRRMIESDKPLYLDFRDAFKLAREIVG